MLRTSARECSRCFHRSLRPSGGAKRKNTFFWSAWPRTFVFERGQVVKQCVDTLENRLVAKRTKGDVFNLLIASCFWKRKKKLPKISKNNVAKKKKMSSVKNSNDGDAALSV